MFFFTVAEHAMFYPFIEIPDYNKKHIKSFLKVTELCCITGMTHLSYQSHVCSHAEYCGHDEGDNCSEKPGLHPKHSRNGMSYTTQTQTPSQRWQTYHTTNHLDKHTQTNMYYLNNIPSLSLSPYIHLSQFLYVFELCQVSFHCLCSVSKFLLLLSAVVLIPSAGF